MKFSFLFFVAAGLVLAFADCQQKNVYVKNGAELRNLLTHSIIEPGTNIILTPGETYSSDDSFMATLTGKIDCPIVVKTDGHDTSKGFATVATSFQLVMSENVRVANIRFTGANVAHFTAKAAFTADGENILFENVYFSSKNDTGSGGYGVFVEYSLGADNLTFRNCTFENNDVGVGIEQADNISFEHCHFVHNANRDLSISGRDSISITKSSFEGVSYSFIENVANLVITDNVFKATTKELCLSLMNCDTKGTRNNSFYMESGVAIVVDDDEEKICVSNKVYGGATLTYATLDEGC